MDRRWIFGEVFCKITRFCFSLNLYGSIGFLTCISVYRYLAIVHPMRVMGRIAVTHTVAISVMVWLLVSVQSLPDMFFTKTLENTKECLDTTNKKHLERYLEYSLGWTLTGFCIPFLITLGCYGHVIVIICKSNSIDKISRGLVCLNSALNPLVYLHGNENIGAQLMQLLQRAWQAVRQLFNRRSHVPVVQII
ncbi:P2Y purinoceptor 1 [Larimichthys crocea]|uniref:P2Y purinoceptor 1 n=1 Tax=Larimichthys crocea TaxID=215358 RepID=A0A6G0INJ7_LARCR|nr:P2Y purinoceptor 1 [Larimichthys crocea]